MMWDLAEKKLLVDEKSTIGEDSPLPFWGQQKGWCGDSWETVLFLFEEQGKACCKTVVTIEDSLFNFEEWWIVDQIGR